MTQAAADLQDTGALETARRVLALEAEALSALAAAPPAGLAPAAETILACSGRVIVAGIGKSGHVARKIASTFASTGTRAMFLHPAEASHGDLGAVAPGDAVLALSNSGETRELADLIHYCKRFSIPLIAMTARADSSLAAQADMVIAVPAAPEACAETQAPTTSTTLMMALGDALAVAVLERRGFTASEFRHFHPGGALGGALKAVRDLMHTGAELPLAPPGMPMRQAAALISEKGFGCLGVVAPDGRLAGMITDGDLRRRLADGLASRHVEEVMSADPVTVTADALASAALRTMNERRITQLFVVEDGRPVGLIHVHDFLRGGVM
jgi:arabinose-5-phosphate isomerase